MASRKKLPKSTQKVDLYKEHASEYAAARHPALVDIGPAAYLAIDGVGEPGGEAFTGAIGALYNVAFTVKMARKFAGRDYAVAKLEGLWWAAAKTEDFMALPKHEWRWKLMIRVPEFITAAEVSGTIDSLIKKGKSNEVKRVRLETLDEGRCVQMLHVGPYDDEVTSVQSMRDTVAAAKLRLTGRHHEIYLSDPRRVAPEKLRTILRHPVR